jgi:hypothetical protein
MGGGEMIHLAHQLPPNQTQSNTNYESVQSEEPLVYIVPPVQQLQKGGARTSGVQW